MGMAEKQDLVKSSEPLDSNSKLAKWQADLESRLTEAQATLALADLLSLLPNAKPQDELGYSEKAIETLRQFPRDVALRCCTKYGVARKTSPWLPTVPQILDWCEGEASKLAHEIEGQVRARKQIEERKKAEEPIGTPESRARVAEGLKNLSNDLKAKNAFWTRDDRRQEALARMRAGDQALLRRECQAAGLSPDSSYSPSLLASIKRRDEEGAQ